MEEPGISSATLKLWELDKLLKGASVTPIKSSRVFNNKYPESEVTALAIQDNANQTVKVAVGLGSGAVYILQVELAGAAVVAC